MSTEKYTRTKEEYIALVANLIEVFGTELTLPAFKLNQTLRFDMLNTNMRQDVCHLLLQRLPRSFNKPEGIQRAYKNPKIAEISKLSNDILYSAPGSIVGSILPKDRGGLIQIRGSKQSKVFEIRVDLKEIQKRLEKSKADADGYVEEEAFKVGYMIDAHHRTEGHYQAGRLELEMVAVLYVDLPKKEMARVFALVNDKQERPSQTHTIAMKQMAGMLKDEQKMAVELVESLNKDETSILYQRIKMFDGRIPRDQPTPYTNLKAFSELLAKHVVTNIPGEDIATKQEVIEGYFRAWKNHFPEAWEDEKTHVLVKSMGFSIMIHLFGHLCTAARSKYHTDAPTKAQFVKLIQPLTKMKLSLEDNVQDGQVVLDWSSEKFGNLSSGKGINFLVERIRRYLVNQKV